MGEREDRMWRRHTERPRRIGASAGVVARLGRSLLLAAVIAAAPASAIAQQPAATPPLVVSGAAADDSYSPRSLVVPFGGVHARSAMMGCEDQAVALSAIASGAASWANSGVGLHAGFDGGCRSGLDSLAHYGSFDAGAVFEQAYSNAPPITIEDATYSAAGITLRRPLSPVQISQLTPWVYVLTNSIDASGRPFGSYVRGVSADGRRISVVGWTVLGGGNAEPGQVPGMRYQPGTGSGPIVWLGQPSALFTRNEVCSLEPNMPMVRQALCTEVDVVNNSGAHSDRLNGYSILSLGAAGGGIALYVAGQRGLPSAFDHGVYIANFQKSGMTITQAGEAGGVGLDIVMRGGIPFNIGNGVTNVAQFDTAGDLRASGVLTPGRFSAAALPGCGAVELGAHIYVVDARKPGEPPGAGSGVPADCTPPRKGRPPQWLSVYDHEAVRR